MARASRRGLIAGVGEFGCEARPDAEPAKLRSFAFEEWIERRPISFDAGDLDDLLDPPGQEVALAVVEVAGPIAMDDDVEFADPVECLLGLDARTRSEGEADEVFERVFCGLPVDRGHAGVAGRERP